MGVMSDLEIIGHGDTFIEPTVLMQCQYYIALESTSGGGRLKARAGSAGRLGERDNARPHRREFAGRMQRTQQGDGLKLHGEMPSNEGEEKE